MASKQVLYWDACIFYEWLGKEQVEIVKKDGVSEILKNVDKGEAIIITSVVTHLEVLPTKLTQKDASDEDDYLALFDAKKFHEIEISANVLLRAREIRDYYYKPAADDGTGGKMMDLGDCIHLATATLHAADEFHTRDGAKKGSKVPLLKLYELSGDTKLCGKYDLPIVSPEADQGRLDGL